jgi:hypothetical protein
MVTDNFETSPEVIRLAVMMNVRFPLSQARHVSGWHAWTGVSCVLSEDTASVPSSARHVRSPLLADVNRSDK